MSQPPPQVLELIQRFDRNREAYRSPHYNETQLRREFLDPFFKALGWDMDNEQGYAEAYKDVVHEGAIKVAKFTKTPDYCFRVGGTQKFLLEAKRPSVDIQNDITYLQPGSKSRSACLNIAHNHPLDLFQTQILCNACIHRLDIESGGDIARNLPFLF